MGAEGNPPLDFAKQIASTLENLFLNQILQAVRCTQSLLALWLDLVAQERHGSVEVMQIERFGSRNEIVFRASVQRLDRCHWQRADATR